MHKNSDSKKCETKIFGIAFYRQKCESYESKVFQDSHLHSRATPFCRTNMDSQNPDHVHSGRTLVVQIGSARPTDPAFDFFFFFFILLIINNVDIK